MAGRDRCGWNPWPMLFETRPARLHWRVATRTLNLDCASSPQDIRVAGAQRGGGREGEEGEEGKWGVSHVSSPGYGVL